MQSDAAYRESLGGIVYLADQGYAQLGFSELQDPILVMNRVKQTGAVASLWPEGVVCFAPPPADVITDAIEYYNAARDHYFYTADVGEQTAVDAGLVGNWQRTGKSFKVVTLPGCPDIGADQHPVYLYNDGKGGTPSHRYTTDRAVVEAMKAQGWIDEGVAMCVSR